MNRVKSCTINMIAPANRFLRFFVSSTGAHTWPGPCFAILAAFTGWAISQPAHSQNSNSNQSVTIQSSKGMVWNENRRKATFNGDVEAISSTWRFEADFLVAEFDPEQSNRLKRIVAKKNVSFYSKSFTGSSPEIDYTAEPGIIRFFGLGEKRWTINDAEIHASGQGTWIFQSNTFEITENVRFTMPDQDLVGSGAFLSIAFNNNGARQYLLKSFRLEGNARIRFGDHHFSGDTFIFDNTTGIGSICGSAQWLWRDIFAQSSCYDFNRKQGTVETRGGGHIQW